MVQLWGPRRNEFSTCCCCMGRPRAKKLKFPLLRSRWCREGRNLLDSRAHFVAVSYTTYVPRCTTGIRRTRKDTTSFRISRTTIPYQNDPRSDKRNNPKTLITLTWMWAKGHPPPPGKATQLFPVASAQTPRRKPMFKVHLLLILCCPALTAPKEAPVFIRCLRSSRILGVLLDLGYAQQLMGRHAYANIRARGENKSNVVYGQQMDQTMLAVFFLPPPVSHPMRLAHTVNYMPSCPVCSVYGSSGWNSACWQRENPAGDQIFPPRY